MRAIRTTLAVFALSLGALSLAQNKEVEDLLSKMRNVYSGIKTAEFAVDASLTNPAGGTAPMKISGKYKATNRVRSTVVFQGQTIQIYSTGKIVTAMPPGAENAIEMDYSHDAINQVIQANLEILCLWDWKRQLSTAEGDNMNESKLSLRKNVKWNDKDWVVLLEEAPQANVYVEYYIDPKTSIIWRTIVHTLEDHTPFADYKVTTWKTGMAIDDKTFIPPVITGTVAK